MKVKQTLVIILWFVLYWHSDLKGSRSNVTVDIQLYLQTHTIYKRCFLKCIN
jgi:hypothetical protein